jgi:hypothetical protein
MRWLNLGLVALIAVAVLGLAAQWLWTIPVIQAGSNDPDLMDFKNSAVPVDEVRSYLVTMTQTARETYLGPQRVLDTVFPVALAGALALSTVLVWRSRIGRLAYVGALVPLVYLYTDMLENALVAQLLRSDVPATADIELVLLYTSVKFQLVTVSGLIVALGVFSGLVRHSIDWIRRAE